jgi:hypothetical protein
MTMLEKVKSIKDTVKSILTERPATRDNDRLLMLHVWGKERICLGEISFRNFARDFARGAYSDPESIRRSRQKIQERHPELRGSSYRTRKDVEEPEMRQEIVKE